MPPRRPSVTPQSAGLTLTSIVPNSLPAGSPPATVDIYGTNFDSTCTVEADTVSRATFFIDAGHLQYTARPDTQTGASTHQITIADGQGNISNPLPFTFTGPPSVATIGFWTCDCGLSISASRPISAAPICVCQRTMYEVTGLAPKVLYDVVFVDRQDQRNR